MTQQLQELTDLTIKEIQKLEIVLPEIYRDIFYTKAQEMGIKLSEIDKEVALFYALKKIQHIQKETENSTSILKENVVNARQAIINKDNVALDFIENNVSLLEHKIIELQQELYTDELTRLLNRKWLFEKYLDEGHFKNNGVLSFIDINDFKNVNDQFGHLVGDKVLHVMGKVLKKIDNVQALRFAGDEFLLLSHEHTEEMLSKILHTVNQNLKKTSFSHQNTLFYIDFAFGMTTFSKGESFKRSLEKADQQMYHYKKSLK